MKPIDKINRALLLLLCILVLLRGFIVWPAAELSARMRWNGFCLGQDLSSLRGAVRREQEGHRVSPPEAAKLLVLIEDAERNVAAFYLRNPLSSGSYDAERLLEQDQDVIHSVCAIKSRGVDTLANSEARTHLATLFGRSQTDLQAGLTNLATGLHLIQ